MEGERDDGQSGRVTTAHFASLIIHKVKTMVTMMMKMIRKIKKIFSIFRLI